MHIRTSLLSTDLLLNVQKQGCCTSHLQRIQTQQSSQEDCFRAMKRESGVSPDVLQSVEVVLSILEVAAVQYRGSLCGCRPKIVILLRKYHVTKSTEQEPIRLPGTISFATVAS